MPSVDTKQRILDVSLKLFSRNGFTAISIRDICAQVNIKESSVYYHFKNKRAILEELKLRFEATANRMMGQLNEAMKNAEDLEGNGFQMVSDIFFEQYLMDDFCNRFMRLMYIEQCSDEEMQRLYDQWMFAEPLRFQSGVFTELMSQKLMPCMDSEYLALKYYSPIFLYFQRYLLSGPLTGEKKSLFRRKIDQHIHHFFTESGAN
jgi:Transcriptional regulator